ncbi:MAG: DUF3127 domain-containing protein [Prevotella sp.]|nr:DUF3127 domain-containing protein [Prevotella sp.]
MELQGKIIAALPERSGTSARGDWKVQEFVLETLDAQYPRKMVFDVFGAERLQRFNIQVGQTVNVAFDIDAREYNGRWYNSVRAFDVRQVDPSQPAPSVPEAAPVSAPVDAPVSADGDVTDSPDNLPF